MTNKGIKQFYNRALKLEDKSEKKTKIPDEDENIKNKSKEKERIEDGSSYYPQEIQELLTLFELNPKEKYTLKEIDEQKRYLNIIYHPDKNTNLNEKSKKKAENKLKQINNNYDKLSKFFK